jgi:hypothetical protein
MSLSSTLAAPSPARDLQAAGVFVGSGTPSSLAGFTPSVSQDPRVEAPKRIGLSDMSLSKFATLGASFIVGLETVLFPLNTMQTILMSERVSDACMKYFCAHVSLDYLLSLARQDLTQCGDWVFI